jgi:hypothetical protein
MAGRDKPGNDRSNSECFAYAVAGHAGIDPFAIMRKKGEEMTVECRDWQEAVAWARIECRTYGLAPIDFPNERPADA